MTETMKRRLKRLERFNTGLVTITFEDGTKRKMNPLDALDTVFFRPVMCRWTQTQNPFHGCAKWHLKRYALRKQKG